MRFKQVFGGYALWVLFSQQTVPLPKQAYPPNQEDAVWKANAEREGRFLELLKAVDEPSLLERSKDTSAQSYRFLWMFRSSYPLCIRLDLLPDGSGILITKHYASPQPNPDPRQNNARTAVPKEEVASFVASVHKLELWKLPYEETLPKGVYVMDGVSLIFEEASHGEYHIIRRHSPTGEPLIELGEQMYRWGERSR